MSDRFHRTRIMIGDEGLERLAAARVLVVGLGAVGSFAVEGLARAGVGNFTLVDGDCIEPSNINRQLYALESTIGRPKAELAAARVVDINPDCHADARKFFVSASNIPELLEPGFDAVVDAIDSIDAKVDLIRAAIERGIPIFSSMGAARRRNPMAIRVGDITKTSGCPLAREVRKRLRACGIFKGVNCVYSIEPASAKTLSHYDANLPLDEEIRTRKLGSLPTITGTFGLALANITLEKLLG